MKHLIIGGIAALAIGLVAAPAGLADPGNDECCAHEFDWATPYIEALDNHGLGDLVYNHGIPVALAAEDVCQGASARFIDHEYDELNLAQAEKVANAVYDDVCPEARP
jgi:hypothetical protein